MAEACSDSSAAVAASMDSILTECPICLEQFRSPKSLPCLHTFCKECLREFIQNHATDSSVTSFSCPICRQIAKPVNSRDDSSVWAEQFPTNNFVTAILEMKDLQISKNFCAICQRKNNPTTPAEFWCKDCAMFLCLGCREVHDMFNSSHVLLTSKDVEGDPAKALKFITKCETHDEELKLFCCDHQNLCCTMCVAVQHRRCDTVITVKEHVKSLKDNNTIEKFKAKIEKHIHSLDNMLENSEAHVHKLSNDKTQMLTDVIELRSRLNKHLDKLQENFSAQVMKNIESHTSSTEKRIKQIQSLKCAMIQSQKQIQAAHFSMNDTQVMEIFMSTKTQQEFYEHQLCDIKAKYENIRESMKPSDVVLTFFGTEAIAELKREVVQLPHSISEHRNINYFNKYNTVSLIGTVPVHSSRCRITGALFVNKNRLVTIDYHNCKLNCHSVDGNLLFGLRLDTSPWDVCKVDGTTLAVTAGRKLLFVELTEEKFSIREIITVPGECFGIACKDTNTFLLTCPRTSRVLIYSKSSQAFNAIPGNNAMWHAVSTGSRRVVMSLRTKKWGKQMLQILNKDTAIRNFFLNDIAIGARGLDSDTFENIYVCATNSHHIVMVSPAGQGKILLSKKDGLQEPCAIAVNGDKMVVFEEKRNIGKIFQFLC